jgi:hypothetical protein
VSNQSSVLVQRRLKIRVPSSGEERDIVIEIGQPYRVGSDEDAACPVAIRGLFERLADIHGIDAMDALRLAIEFVEKTLRGKSEELQILWPNGEPYFKS